MEYIWEGEAQGEAQGASLPNPTKATPTPNLTLKSSGNPLDEEFTTSVPTKLAH